MSRPARRTAMIRPGWRREPLVLQPVSETEGALQWLIT